MGDRVMTTSNIERHEIEFVGTSRDQLHDEELTQVSSGRANFDDLKIVKHVDKAST
jgi:hypothetical protein